MEPLARNRGELIGVVVAGDGSAYVSDAKRGEILKIDPAGSTTVAAAGLRRPSGLALAGADLLIAEEGAGRVLRMTPTGAITIFADGIRTPRWLAEAADGAIYITGSRLRGPDGSGRDEASVIIRRDPSTGTLNVVATDVHQLEGLAVNGVALFAAAGWIEGLPKAQGVIARYPLRPDGGLDPPAYFAASGVPDPRGLVLDPLAALYVSSGSVPAGDRATAGDLVKAHPDAHLTLFATSLSDPRGLALGPDGSLFAADGHSGRLLRFAAPPNPKLNPLPPFTSESPLPVGGTAVPIARLDLFVNDGTTATTGASDNAGVFALKAPLELNARNVLEVFATANLGEGLTSAPTKATLIHDGQAPSVSFVTPPGNAFLRQTVTVQAQASGGGGSPVASLSLTAGGQPLATTLSPAPPAPAITATASWNTGGLPEGAQTLAATATDQAGNVATATRSVIVDNTPPDTQITAGPDGVTSGTSATFTVSGTDNLAPTDRLEYAWRLDGGAYAPFSPGTQILVSGLAAGGHAFEVKARDLAGNEDPTPAGQSFAVIPLSIEITSPASGATVPAGILLVRGNASAGGGEVGVVVNLQPAAVRGGVFMAKVFVDQDTTELVAMATDAGGATTSATIPITVVGTPSSEIALRASPSSGVAPLQVSFTAAGAWTSKQVTADFDGDGRVDFQGARLDGAPFTYALPGLYLATASVSDRQGNQVDVFTTVEVYDRAALDALLQAKWASMKDALRAGDIPRALEAVTHQSRERYGRLFTDLQPQFGRIDTILTDIEAVDFHGRTAEYQMLRTRGNTTLSYLVGFLQDEDGIWRLDSF
jgi:hypothetical protein